jgi:hypothetical protein
MNRRAPWVKVLLSTIAAFIALTLLNAYANGHSDREPVNHFFSHLAAGSAVAILLYSSQRFWTAPKTRAELWPRRILVTGISVGLFASILGGLSALPGVLNEQQKEIQLITSIHRFDQPFLALGFLLIIGGVILTVFFRIFFRMRTSPID